MNWLELTHTYPKVMTDFRNWAYEKNMGFNPHNRVLFDFFDEQGLKVVVSYNPDSCQMESGIWENRIYLNGVGRFNTRQEAEEQAFTKAFEILEQKLKEGK